MSRALPKKSDKRKNVNIVEFQFLDGSIFMAFDDEGREIDLPECREFFRGNNRWIPKSEIIKN